MALTPDQWAAIRRAWEHDPDTPSYAEAAKRAGEKFGFSPPAKQSVGKRATAEKWERLGVASMASVNAAAQRKADMQGGGGKEAKNEGDGEGDAQGDATPGKKGSAPPPAEADPSAARSSAAEAEDLRAKVIARHRQEWLQIIGVRQEALRKRGGKDPVSGVTLPGSFKDAFEAMKLAKITAEATHIQQAGERKAWGLDVVIDPDQMTSLGDEDLRAIAAGRPPRKG